MEKDLETKNYTNDFQEYSKTFNNLLERIEEEKKYKTFSTKNKFDKTEKIFMNLIGLMENSYKQTNKIGYKNISDLMLNRYNNIIDNAGKTKDSELY